MTKHSWWRRYWRSLGFGREVGEELQFHVEMLTRDLVAGGMEPAAAAREAARRFGDQRGVRHQLERIERRRGARLRLWLWLEEIGQDLRLGVRGLIKRPGYTAAAVASLGLGIASTTVLLSIADAWLLKPLAVDRPGELVVIGARTKAYGPLVFADLSLPTVADLEAERDLFTGVAAWHMQGAAIRRPTTTRSEVAWLLAVTPNYFSLLGVEPRLGRLFSEQDGRAREPVLVLNHDYWSTQLGADRGVVGQPMLLNGMTFTVIGVLPPSFSGSEHLLKSVGFITVQAESNLDPTLRANETDRAHGGYQAIARRTEGVSLTRVQAGLDVLAGRLAREMPERFEGYSLVAFPENQARPTISTAEQMPIVTALLAALALLVLGTAAVNVANLVLARASARKEELVVRLALGASRWRLVRQLLTESLLLGALGFGAAMVFARLVVGWIIAAPIAMPIQVQLGFETGGRVAAMSLVASLVAGLFAGFGPALVATRDSLQTSLRRGLRSGPSGGRLRAGLLTAQVAAAAVALVIAGLLIGSSRRAMRIDLGMDPRGLMTTLLDAKQARLDSLAAPATFRRLRQELEATPGITGVAFAGRLPLSPPGWQMTDIFLGRDNGAANRRGAVSVLANAVDPEFFDLLRLRLRSGRLFRREDDSLAPRVAIVNEQAAKTLWPGENPLGQIFRDRVDGPPTEVVGVVADGRYILIGESPRPVVFRALPQVGGTFAALLVRAQLDPAETEARVREAIGRVEPNLAPTTFQPMERLIRDGPNGLLPLRAGAFLAMVIGGLVLLLTVVGLYGVLAYSVTQETREIGVRMALGAEPGRIVGRVLSRGGRFVALGMAIGIPLALLIGRRMGSILVGGRGTDLGVYTAVAGLLVAITAAAAYLPARRASRLDPVRALRSDG